MKNLFRISFLLALVGMMHVGDLHSGPSCPNFVSPTTIVTCYVPCDLDNPYHPNMTKAECCQAYAGCPGTGWIVGTCAPRSCGS